MSEDYSKSSTANNIDGGRKKIKYLKQLRAE